MSEMNTKIYASQDWVNERLEDILPPITEADNGKVLMVVDGQLQFVTLNLAVDENGVLKI